MQPDEMTVCLYVTKLAETCSYRTIKNYINGICILHLEAGLTNPLPAMFNLERTLRGIKRVKGDVQPNRKFAVTPNILSRVLRRLDLFSPEAMAFAAAMLVAFFGFFRKTNVCPLQEGTNPVTDQSPIRKGDFEFAEDMSLVCINLRRTKTIQFGQRTLRVPLPAIPDSILCPVTTIRRLFSAVASGPNDFSFSYPDRTGRLHTLTHKSFVGRFKSELTHIGIDSARYAGHSLSPSSTAPPRPKSRNKATGSRPLICFTSNLTTRLVRRSPRLWRTSSFSRLGGSPVILPTGVIPRPEDSKLKTQDVE
jgi:hypothetical protein